MTQGADRRLFYCAKRIEFSPLKQGSRWHRLQCLLTGLLAWKRGQPGQVGNEAALTVVTSAGVRLVNPNSPTPNSHMPLLALSGPPQRCSWGYMCRSGPRGL